MAEPCTGRRPPRRPWPAPEPSPAHGWSPRRRRRFRLIDLGAAACLRTGTNYKPAETILDPCYCPPEEARPGRCTALLVAAGWALGQRLYCLSTAGTSGDPNVCCGCSLPPHRPAPPRTRPQYVLPTDAPHLGDAGTRLRTVMTPLLWSQHKPDCFDTYSAGVVLMQLWWVPRPPARPPASWSPLLALADAGPPAALVLRPARRAGTCAAALGRKQPRLAQAPPGRRLNLPGAPGWHLNLPGAAGQLFNLPGRPRPRPCPLPLQPALPAHHLQPAHLQRRPGPLQLRPGGVARQVRAARLPTWLLGRRATQRRRCRRRRLAPRLSVCRAMPC